MMNIPKIICRATGSKTATKSEHIQELWSGYGNIDRYSLQGANMDTVVAKHVHFPNAKKHPRGWNTNLSHKRKLKSYEVETAWYQNYASHCNEHCRIPHCYTIEKHSDEVLMVLEDLDMEGFMVRKQWVNWEEFAACLKWLAHFHAIFLGQKPDLLWKNGTYWHLDTRPEELSVLEDLSLKQAASAIDLKLKKTPYLTFVHGDAKLANFCFSRDGKRVAVVDFQYVGGGCGMKDLAYFVGSCFGEDDCASLESQVLETYFKELENAIQDYQKDVDFNLLKENWRSLYPVAWADFHRFLKAWSPGHWKINTYSEEVVRKVIASL